MLRIQANKIAVQAAAVLMLFATPSQRASAQLGVNFTDLHSGYTTYAFTGGWSFTVLSPFSISALGYYDLFGDGLIGPHEVGIFSDAGTLLVAATVTTSDPLTSFWRFAAISPFSLATGSYVIAAWTGRDPYVMLSYLATWEFDPRISYGTNRYLDPSTSLAFPTSSYPDIQHIPFFLGANFIAEPNDIVPEPAIMTLLATGLAGLAAARRRWKKA